MRGSLIIATAFVCLIGNSSAVAQAIASRCDSIDNSRDANPPPATPPQPAAAAVETEPAAPSNQLVRTYQNVTTSISNYFASHLSFADSAWVRGQQMAQDLGLLFQLRRNETKHCQTARKIIQPWVVHYHPGMRAEDIRATYNLCEFVQDQGTQIPRDPRESDTCVTLGDDRGYTIAELQQRYNLLNATVEDLKLAINGTAIGGSIGLALVTRGFLKRFPIFVLGSLTLRNLIVVLPSGVFGTYFVASDSAEVPIRHLVDMRNSFMITAEGRFVRNDKGADMVSVAMPIQKFAPILEEYLNSIHSKTDKLANPPKL